MSIAGRASANWPIDGLSRPPAPGPSEPAQVTSLATELLARAEPRFLLGICGAPGAGKSTLAAQLVAELNRRRDHAAVVLPMDGFHLAASVIAADDRGGRRGAPDTFDPVGFAALLIRVRRGEATVFAPEYRREIEDPVAGAIEIPPSCQVVVVEGNYLLHPDPAWRAAREQLDEVWFLEAPSETQRIESLIQRHERHGKPPATARQHVQQVDQANAVLIESHKAAADRFLRGVW